MSTLITGGTGMLGSATAKRLHADGDDVVILDKVDNDHYLRGRHVHFDDRLRLELADLADFDRILQVIQRYDVERIVHLASAVAVMCRNDPVEATIANCVGTANLLEAARRSDVARIVIASSSAVYGPGEDFTEPHDPGPVGSQEGGHPFAPLAPVYGASKAYQEALARQYQQLHGMEVAGVRPVFMASAGRPNRPPFGVVAAMIDAVARGETVVVPFGRTVFPWVYYQDVVTQLKTLLEAPAEKLAEGPFFDTGGVTVTVADYAAAVRELVPEAKIDIGDEQLELHLGNTKICSGELFTTTFGVQREFDLRQGLAAQLEEARDWGT